MSLLHAEYLKLSRRRLYYTMVVILAALVLTRSILLVRGSSRATAMAQESRERLHTESPAVSPARAP